MGGQLGRRAQRLEVVAHGIERGELHCPSRCFDGRCSPTTERVDSSEEEPAMRMAWVDEHRFVTALARHLQILEEMTVDEALCCQCERVRRIAVERGVRRTQSLRGVTRAVIRPATRQPQDVPVAEPRSRSRNSAMPADQFVEDFAGLEKLLLAGAVHQLDRTEEQRVALE